MTTPSGYGQVSMQLTLTGFQRSAYVTFGIDPADTDPLAIAGAINTAASAANSFTSQMDGSVTLTKIRVSLGTDGGEDLVGELAGTTVGGRIRTSLPPNCALLVHKTSARGGRRGRGRMYLPWFVDETECDEAGVILPASVTQYQTSMNTFRGALSTGGNPMVLLHQPSEPGTVHPTTPGPPNVVTGLVVDRIIATQRRRLGR
jgi:hypothetical protein